MVLRSHSKNRYIKPRCLTATLGRMYNVHIKNFECYCLRLLLLRCKGPTSFTDLKTIDGVIRRTFQEACKNYGLLENDNHYHDTMKDASLCKTPKRMRHLFAVILSTCDVSNPFQLYETYKKDLSYDYLYSAKQYNENIDYCEFIYNQSL